MYNRCIKANTSDPIDNLSKYIHQMTRDLEISWSEYHRKIEELAIRIHNSDWEFNKLVCIAKGGLRVGDSLARIFDLPLAILATSSYGGPDNRRRGNISFSRDLAMTTTNLGSKVLLVDDLADSGVTLGKSISWLKHYYGFYVEEVRTAVLWYKQCSVTRPDFYVDYLEDNPWIRQPFEEYEQLSVPDLIEKHKED